MAVVATVVAVTAVVVAATAGGTMAIGTTAVAVSAAASSSVVVTAATVAGYASATALTSGAMSYGAKQIENNIQFAKNKIDTNSEKKRSTDRIAKRKHFSSKKDAYEAAKRAGGGKEPRHDTKSNPPHYHPNVPNKTSQTPKEPNSHDHYYYPKSKQ